MALYIRKWAVQDMYESYLLRCFTYEQNKGVLHSLIKMRTSFEYIVYAIIVHNVCNL